MCQLLVSRLVVRSIFCLLDHRDHEDHWVLVDQVVPEQEVLVGLEVHWVVHMVVQMVVPEEACKVVLVVDHWEVPVVVHSVEVHVEVAEVAPLQVVVAQRNLVGDLVDAVLESASEGDS